MKLKKQPLDVPEEVYPLHKLDDIKDFRNHVIWMMRFNDVLDAEMLADSLSRLLEIGDWKKLGGRPTDIDKADGRLEVHFRKSSTTGQRNVFFTHDTHDMRIQDHPVASRLPQATDGPSTYLVSDDFRPFIARANFPSFAQSVQQNEPPISLHVTSFNDATLLALSWPHVLMDASAGKALLSGWTSVLAGREDSVPMVIGARDDVLLQTTMSEKQDRDEEFKLEKNRMTGASLLVFYLRCLWDKIWYPRQQRAVFIPQAVLHKLKAEVQQGIIKSSPSSHDVPFVSESDILIAWICQAAASSTSKSRPMTIMSFLDTRSRIPEICTSTGVFLQNMVLSTYAFLSPQTANGPIGPIAISHRRHFAEQSSENQTLCFLRSVYRDIDAVKSPRLVFGEPNAVPILINNVSKAELIKLVDFSPAVVHQGESAETRRNPLGTMVTYWNEGLERGWSGFNVCWMQGRDHDGNFWIMANLLPEAWSRIEEHLQNLHDMKVYTRDVSALLLALVKDNVDPHEVTGCDASRISNVGPARGYRDIIRRQLKALKAEKAGDFTQAEPPHTVN
ncbi:uncharacterized protein N7482_004978 [Penicillium canariense]|uniref:Uncharacterized protein n=1 Tax=Penicillium canariense TaxID=189055 RepID=A0A9W9LM61_9EURO|nr:uncharacterized protein N7482_004978 [Penicillium canariense]KAJ5166197.1 hypothetical protein N7482_004978 [Penicillium canariense]